MAELTDSDRRLGELMLYIAWKSQTDRRFGAVKLNKILYYSDFLAYTNLGKPITGAEYQHLVLGPCPRHLVPVREQLQGNGRAVVQEIAVSPSASRAQERLIALRPPDLSIFSSDEIAIVDDIIEQSWNKTGTQMSDETHGLEGWKLTAMNETIPYFTALLSADAPLPITDEEMEHARDLAQKLHDPR